VAGGKVDARLSFCHSATLPLCNSATLLLYTVTTTLPPKLRALDIRPVEHEGQPFFRFSDPQRLIEGYLLIPQPLAMVLAFCDGRRSIPEMCAAFERHYQVAIDTKVVEDLFQALDKAMMLENARAGEARRMAIETFRSAPYRQPSLAGRSYPADARQLWGHLQGYLEQADVDVAEIDWSTPVGLLSPHIDYPRGGAVYAKIWKRATLAARQAERVILIGTDHYGDDPFTLTRQSYATPYGKLPTVQPVVDRLVDVIGEDAAFAGELRHQGEHSLELVATWLHHMRGGQAVELVPILVGSLRSVANDAHDPSTSKKVAGVLDVLRQACEDQRTLVIASGDLAHVGPAFGGNPLNDQGKAEIKAIDYQLLKQMQAGDSLGFYRSIQSINNRNNVCGVTPIFLTMQTLGNLRGEQFGYAVCPADEANSSIVTVAGVFFGA